MARTLLIFALCVLPALVSATRIIQDPQSDNKYVVRGRAYCDRCRAGFETSATQYIANAIIGLECKDRNTMKTHNTMTTKTDSTGTFEFSVNMDHGNHMCECFLIKSPIKTCGTPDAGRDRSRVILTDNNGIVSKVRYANSMGFLQDQPMAGCTELLKQYQETEDQY